MRGGFNYETENFCWVSETFFVELYVISVCGKFLLTQLSEAF